MVGPRRACDHRRMDAVGASRFARRRQGRWLGGVCAGLAAGLGLPALVVRAVFVALTLTSGPGVLLLYAITWALLPPFDPGLQGSGGLSDAVRGAPHVVDALAVLAMVAGGILLLSEVAAWLPRTVLVPGILAAAGAALVWGWGGRASGQDGARPLLVAVGVSLVVVGGVAMLAAVGSVRTLGRSAAGAAVLVAGVALMLGPWLLRLGRDLTAERRQRIRSQERAEVAAHLHDGVLQTLALIQKRAADDREVRSLARRQERELRSWLYGPDVTAGTAGAPGPDEPATVAGLLRRELDDVEDRYGIRLDSVLVGDAPLDDPARALVAAGREAAQNAARHAGVEAVDVYLEVEPERISLFVRDRGRGFDPAAVPSDRRGVADSICARVLRHGGAAHVRSAPGEGAEVELSVPRTAS